MTVRELIEAHGHNPDDVLNAELGRGWTHRKDIAASAEIENDGGYPTVEITLRMAKI